MKKLLAIIVLAFLLACTTIGDAENNGNLSENYIAQDIGLGEF